MRKRWIRGSLAVAVIAAGTAVTFQLATGSASAEDFARDLQISGVGDIVVDASRKRVFISDPDAGQLLTTDYDGKTLATTAGLAGLRGLALTEAGDRLYGVQPDGNAIVAIDPATSAKVATYPVGERAEKLALSAGKIWFSNRDGIGSVDVSGAQPVVTAAADFGDVRWYYAPMLAAVPGLPGVLAAAGDGISGDNYQLLDVSASTPGQLATTKIDGPYALEFSPDGSRLLTVAREGFRALSATDLTEIERYESRDTRGALAIGGNGTAAVAMSGLYGVGDAALFQPGTATAVRRLPLQSYNGTQLSLTDIAHLAWEPGGRRVFGVAAHSTTASGQRTKYSLQVLNTAKTVTVKLTVPAQADLNEPWTVSGAFGTNIPAGLPMTITRTAPSVSGGELIGPREVPANGRFSFVDIEPAAGKVTYAVSVPGDYDYSAAATTATVDVDVPSKATSLTLDRNGASYSYGTTVTFTAKLGATHSSRAVEIWADPSGPDEPNRLLRKANVDAKGNLSTTFKLARNTKMTAIFRGDARTPAKTVTSNVNTRAYVTTTLTKHYKTANIGSVSYQFFRRTTNPVVTGVINPHPGRKAYMQVDVHRGGKWILYAPKYYTLAGNKVTANWNWTRSVGSMYRVRFVYQWSKSGDTANVTTYGAYRYYTFTN
ncbi:hypothetical protein KOI35_11615 [Actinoplanes bogorensis]|uniref:Uncharacterized protein n=1 Tax=Paractinoplanes bogorensis TaxID=1610840 RepID=A0ABS5YQ53_9ACTN|nr:hypothetical protein [Actinoplanes bogorensis]MBU2664140.1 hypothetical protein [Actinoplanes bogorensis]